MSLLWSIPVALILFLLVAASLRLGWKQGRRRISQQGKDVNEGLGAVDGAIFGLMGLLLAFTFTGAASRFDERRDLIVEEVNAISTAWSRLDLLEPGARDEARELLRQYVDRRLEVYRNVTDSDAVAAGLARIASAQAKLWERLIAATREDRSLPVQTILPAFNEMFDIGETRRLATEMHPPVAIYLMLGLLVMVSAFLAGFGQSRASRQSMLHLAGFAAVTSIAIYFILDMEYPRLGLIRVDSFDTALLELRASMN